MLRTACILVPGKVFGDPRQRSLRCVSQAQGKLRWEGFYAAWEWRTEQQALISVLIG